MPHPQMATWFSFSCFTACNRSTSGTFYVPIFQSVHSSFSAALLASVLAGACNIARSFIATCLLNLTHATFVTTAFLLLFLLDHFIRGFVSGSQPHSRHESFIDPRPIDRHPPLDIFPHQHSACLDGSQPTSTCCVSLGYCTPSPPM